MERLGRVLWRLGASWSVLERPGRVLKRFEAQKEPKRASAVRGSVGVAARLGSQEPTTFKDEGNLLKKDYISARLSSEETLHTDTYRYIQTSTDHLPTHPDTQLGAFGPGADPQRSRAASPQPRH